MTASEISALLLAHDLLFEFHPSCATAVESEVSASTSTVGVKRGCPMQFSVEEKREWWSAAKRAK